MYLCTCSFVYYTHICTLGEHVEVWVERRCQSYRCIYTRQSLQPFANGCSHIAAMCTNIINCFSKSHFSCACLPSYDITGRQFEWFKIVKSKSQQLNSSQLNVCPGWGGGWGVGASAPDGECGEKFCRGLSLSSTDALHWMQEEVLRPRARYYTSMHSMHITQV